MHIKLSEKPECERSLWSPKQEWIIYKQILKKYSITVQNRASHFALLCAVILYSLIYDLSNHRFLLPPEYYSTYIPTEAQCFPFWTKRMYNEWDISHLSIKGDHNICQNIYEICFHRWLKLCDNCCRTYQIYVRWPVVRQGLRTSHVSEKQELMKWILLLQSLQCRLELKTPIKVGWSPTNIKAQYSTRKLAKFENINT